MIYEESQFKLSITSIICEAGRKGRVFELPYRSLYPIFYSEKFCTIPNITKYVIPNIPGINV